MVVDNELLEVLKSKLSSLEQEEKQLFADLNYSMGCKDTLNAVIRDLEGVNVNTPSRSLSIEEEELSNSEEE